MESLHLLANAEQPHHLEGALGGAVGSRWGAERGRPAASDRPSARACAASWRRAALFAAASGLVIAAVSRGHLLRGSSRHLWRGAADGASPLQVKVDQASAPVRQLGERDIVERIKHDASSFLEGLEALPDDLGFIESAGLYGTSRLFAYGRQADNVDVLDSHDLDSKYFGEGITMLGSKVYQLTYKEGDALVYDVTDSASPTTVGEATALPDVVSQFDTKEGWGMTNNGTHAIASDGSASLYFLEPETLKVVKKIVVIGQDPSGSDIDQINELEYVDGLIYFNIWMKDIIGVYDIESKQVTRWFNLSEIALKERNRSPMAEVLNGITFTRPKDTSEPRMLVVTGKQWQNLYVLNHTVPAGR